MEDPFTGGSALRQFLEENFRFWWIGSDGPTPESPLPPDIISLDSFSFGVIPTTVFATPVHPETLKNIEQYRRCKAVPGITIMNVLAAANTVFEYSHVKFADIHSAIFIRNEIKHV